MGGCDGGVEQCGVCAMEVGGVLVFGLDQWLGRCCVTVTAMIFICCYAFISTLAFCNIIQLL